MNTLRDILAAASALNGSPAALATVVKKRGSSYRQTGARLLIRQDGSAVGSISGGCLEADVIAKAQKLIASGHAELAVFDMTTPDDDLWGYSQGCNGVISVLIEPLNSITGADPYAALTDAIFHRRRSVLVTVIRTEGNLTIPLGSRIHLNDRGNVVENIRHPVVTSALVEEAAKAFHEGTSRSSEIRLTEGIVEAFVEAIHPPVLVIIAGAGTDAIPVHRLAFELGWQTWITDHRPGLVSKERFPLAERLLPGRAGDIVPELRVDRRTAVVIMTHQFEHDLALLSHFIRKPLSYVGLLGPAKRCELLLQRLRDQGVALSSDQRAALYAPVGLNIGAETPEEIALAIMGEIQAVVAGQTGGFMRNKRGPIHG